MSRPKPGGTNRAWWLLSLAVLFLGGTVLAADAARLWTEKHVNTFRTEIQQVEIALGTAGEDPAGAVFQAQQHLAQARAELDILQPVAGPCSTWPVCPWLAGRSPSWPRCGVSPMKRSTRARAC